MGSFFFSSLSFYTPLDIDEIYRDDVAVTVNLVHARTHARTTQRDAACVTLRSLARSLARPHTFHSNPDRIRRTVGERAMCLAYYRHTRSTPVPPWRQPGLLPFLSFAVIPSSLSLCPPALFSVVSSFSPFFFTPSKFPVAIIMLIV